MIKLYGYLIILVFFWSCKEHGKSATVAISKNKNIIMLGKTDDPKAFVYLNLLNAHSFGQKHIKPSLDISSDSVKAVIKSINRPQIVNLMAFGDSTFYSTRFYTAPGDSIYLSIKNKRIRFLGNKAAEYNFFTLLDSTDSEWSRNKYMGNLYDYKRRCDSIYQKRQQFFKNYVSENTVSEKFEDLVGAELKYEYLHNLIAPRMQTGIEVNYNVPGGFITALAQNGDVEKSGFFDLSTYLDHVTIKDFNKPNLINSDYFRRCLKDFVKYYFVSSEYLPYTREAFNAHKKYVEKHLTGVLRYIAMVDLISDYHENGFGVGPYNRDIFLDVINTYDRVGLNLDLQSKLNDIRADLEAYDSGFEASHLGESLITMAGDTTTVGRLLAETKGRVKIIDFWASWCSPCIKEIRNGKEFKKKLNAIDNVEWVYISIEKDFKDWNKMSNKLKGFLDSQHQYKLSRSKKSKWLKDLRVQVNGMITVPKYIIIGTDNRIISLNAPRPSDSITLKSLLEKIK